MLIDFTVENYRSINEPVTLSFIADNRGPGKSRQGTGKRLGIKTDEEIAASYAVDGRGFSLLPVVGIFGANASGKSNVLRALHHLVALIILGGADESAQLRALTPFALDPATTTLPTVFQLRLLTSGGLFTVGLSADRVRIREEFLDYIPASGRRRRVLYSRTWDEQQQASRWRNGPDFAGPHLQLEPQVHEAEPFIHILIRQLRVPVIEPLALALERFWPLKGPETEESDARLARRWLQGNAQSVSFCTGLLRELDTGVTGFELLPKASSTDSGSDDYDVVVEHESACGRVRWPLQEESAGTVRLFGLLPQLQLVLAEGGVLAVDELGSNIHPAIVRTLVRLFQNTQTNPRRSQLLFTSHDNTLLRTNLLRRDQVWFTQKERDGSTELYSASDFRPRNDLAIDRAYLDGRFGAVPIIPPEDLLIGRAEATA